MAKEPRIVYAVTRAKREGPDEFYISHFPNQLEFTPHWQLALKMVHKTHLPRRHKADDMPIGYLIPLEDDDD